VGLLDRRIGRLGFTVGYAASAAALIAIPALMHLYPGHQQKTVALMFLAAFGVGGMICVIAWRCHDFGKTGWHYFWTDQVPVVGSLWALLELFFLPGDQGRNGYGDPPSF
jgi:uncharacterized membrane protein YhaH (DUF805 family)